MVLRQRPHPHAVVDGGGVIEAAGGAHAPPERKRNASYATQRRKLRLFVRAQVDDGSSDLNHGGNLISNEWGGKNFTSMSSFAAWSVPSMGT